MKIQELIARTLIPFFIGYLIFCFCSWSFDLASLEVIDRVLILFLGVLFFLVNKWNENYRRKI